MPHSSWVAALLLTIAWMEPAFAARGVDRRVAVGGDLQQALNEARPGDRIVLEPGAIYVGNFVLPVHSGADSVTVTTDPAGLPGPGDRVTPAHAPQLAKIRTPNGDPAIRTAPRARKWRLQLLEVTGSRGSELIALGDGGRDQRTIADVPRDLVVDRCYIHGDGTLANGPKRGIALNSGRAVVAGSTIAEITRRGQDTQAIGGWNGPGPFLIENNRLEAGGENIMFGGSQPSIDGLVPSDVTVRRNYFTRPLAWRDQRLAVKNLFELKNARRVLVGFNLFEHNWADGQAGYAIVFTPRGEAGRAPWSTVEDVTFRYNIVRHAGGGLNILGRDDTGDSGQLRRLRISHNIFYDIDDAWGGSGTFVQIGGEPTTVLIDHNTVLQSGTLIAAYGGTRNAPRPIQKFVFRDNLARHNRYGILGTGRSSGNDTIQAFFPDGVFDNNVIAGARASLYPADNLFPSVEEFEAQFVNPREGDLALVPSSSFRQKATDGRDLGADVSRIMRSMASAAAGPGPGLPSFEIRRPVIRPEIVLARLGQLEAPTGRGDTAMVAFAASRSRRTSNPFAMSSSRGAAASASR